MEVILGVTGCIAAYKAAVILRLLQEKGCVVRVVMTSSARQFITPLTLEKLSGKRVVSDLFSDHTTEIEHISLARESHLLLVAPATANILAKFAHGIADDFLSTLYVSTVTPVVVAPAMNVEMWRHPATQENLEILRKRGVVVVEPGRGYLACGEYGEGRLAEPEEVAQVVLETIHQGSNLVGKKVLVTAGPTVEDIDPVRFLSNRSSGKMGYAVARAAQRRGAHVTLIAGPTHLAPPSGVEFCAVRSAAEMAGAVLSRFSEMDVVVMAAAVADYRPEALSSDKIKKSKSLTQIRLTPTVDILQELGRVKKDQILVGFAAESEQLLDNARRKLEQKNLDLVVANDISKPGQGFESESNQVVLIDVSGREEELPLLPKSQVAEAIWDRVERAMGRSGPATAPGK